MPAAISRPSTSLDRESREISTDVEDFVGRKGRADLSGKAGLDRAEQVFGNYPCPWLRIQAALQEDLDPARGDGLGDLGGQLLPGEGVAAGLAGGRG